MELSVDKKLVGRVEFLGHAPDRLVNFDQSALGHLDFYTDFYADSSNPLEMTRMIQFQQIGKWLEPLLSKAYPPIHLDVGCGSGLFVQFFRTNIAPEFQSFGIDPYLSTETAYLKKMALNEVSSSLSIPKKYGVISLLDVLEHFPDPNEALNTVSDLLETNGLLLIKVPNKRALLYRAAKLLRHLLPKVSNAIFVRLYQAKYPPPHYFYFDSESLHSLLKSRFTVITKRYQSEMPLGGLLTRFWGISPSLKIFAIMAGGVLNLLSRGPFNDAVVVIARKNQ